MDLPARLQRTLDLLGARGYALPPEQTGRLMVGGPVPAEQVLAAVEQVPDAAVRHGLVWRPGIDAARARRRQLADADDAPPMWSVTQAYVHRLVGSCPWVRIVLAAGSLSSGGYRRGDDLDLDLVVEDHAKYLTYLTALVLALPVSWRLRRSVACAHATPLLPKTICLNVVWEERQTRPFARQDESLAFELLLARPLHGQHEYRDMLLRNPGLLHHFPQLLEQGNVHDPAPEARSWGWHVLRASTAWLPLRRVLDAACFVVVRGLHAWVRWHRRDQPELRRHVEAMEAHKRPYGIMDRPGRVSRWT